MTQNYTKGKKKKTQFYDQISIVDPNIINHELQAQKGMHLDFRPTKS